MFGRYTGLQKLREFGSAGIVCSHHSLNARNPLLRSPTHLSRPLEISRGVTFVTRLRLVISKIAPGHLITHRPDQSDRGRTVRSRRY